MLDMLIDYSCIQIRILVSIFLSLSLYVEFMLNSELGFAIDRRYYKVILTHVKLALDRGTLNSRKCGHGTLISPIKWMKFYEQNRQLD